MAGCVLGFVVFLARRLLVMRILGLWSVCLVSGGHLQGNRGCARYWGLCARRWQVILVFRGRGDFRGNAVAPLYELFPVRILVLHLFVEHVSVLPVNFTVGSGSIAV